MIKLDCPACGNPLIGPDEFAGKSARCPACRTSVPAPEITAPEPTEQTPAPAKTEDSSADDLLSEARAAAKKETRPETKKKTASEKPIDASPKKKHNVATGTIVAFSLGIAAILIAGIVTAAYVSNVTRERRIGHLNAQSQLQLNSARRSYEDAMGYIEQARDAMEQNEHDNAAVAYTRARTHLETARSRLSNLIRNMDASAGRYSQISNHQEWTQRRDAANRLADSVKDRLESEEVRKGQEAGEVVLFEGQWVTPEEYSRLYAESMERQGMVQYEGEWVTFDEAQRRRGYVLHEGNWITQEQLEAIRARVEARQAALEERRRRDAQEAARREEERRRRLDRFPPDAETWVIDDLATEGAWSAAAWANPCSIALVQREGRNALQLEARQGGDDKSAIQIDIGADFSSRRSLTIDIENTGRRYASIAIAFQTNDFYESRPERIQPGKNNITFDLTSGDFKSRRTDWAHSSRLMATENVARMFILIYRGDSQTYYITNIYASKAQ